MEPRIDFLVIGAQKCATSWLYYCLRDHPEIHLPSHKREEEYLGGEIYRQRGIEWYFDRLRGARDDQRCGDVSVEYMKDISAPEQIYQIAPKVKLVALLRDPIDRAISAYFWNARKGLVSEANVSTAIAHGLQQIKYGTNETASPLVDFIERGFYDTHISRFLSLFSRTQLCVALYEEVASDPLSVVRRIFSFLGVNADFTPRSLNDRPKNNTYLRALIAAERLAPSSRVVAKLMDRANTWATRVGVAGRKPQLASEHMTELRECYRSHIHGLEGILSGVPPLQRPRDIDLSRTWRLTS